MDNSQDQSSSSDFNANSEKCGEELDIKQQIYKENIAKLEFVHKKISDTKQTTLAKIKSIDEKLNMILVFNAAMFILLSVVFPITTQNSVAKAFIYFFVSLFALSSIATIITILVALFPKKYARLSLDTYKSPNYFKMSLKKIYETEMDGEWRSAKSLQDILQIKSNRAIAVTVLSIINIVLIMISTLLSCFVK